jgi:uncharacterized protein YcbX
MPIKVGEVEAIFRYPVKSMRGERLETAELGWHGLDGDRRLAFRRADDRGGFPWLTASKLPELILFAPQRREPALGGTPPRTFARRKERSWLCSARNWRRTLVAAMVRGSR